MKAVLLLCESYDEIKSCLYIAKRNSEQNNPVNIVVVGNHDLFRFLDAVNKRIFNHTLNIIYFDFFKKHKPGDGKIKKALHHIRHIIETRAYYRHVYHRYLAAFRGVEVYFFTRYYNPYSPYFLKKLGKNNDITFMCVFDWESRIKNYPLRGLTDLMNRTKLILVYGFYLTIAKLPHDSFPYITERFMAREVNKIINKKEAEELLKDFNYDEFRIFDSDRYSVIYFEQPLVDAGRVPDEYTFKKEINAVFKILSRYFPDDEIAIKYHPMWHGDKTMIKTGVMIEDFIPAELLYNDKVKMYLSFSSGSLANVEKGLAVSLIDLVSYKDNDAKVFIKENLLRRSRSEILFPKSLDEFESIIRNITRERVEDEE